MNSCYEGPSVATAEKIHALNEACRVEKERLKGAAIEELKRVLRDQGESSTARCEAMCQLLSVRDSELPEILLELMDDAQKDVAGFAIKYVPLTNARVIDRLKLLVLSDVSHQWSEAALRLARAKEISILPILLDWLHRADEPHRNAATQALRWMKRPESLQMLQDEFESGGREENHRLHLAAVLLDLGDARGLSLLEARARKASDSWSVFAATSIYFPRPKEGLFLMKEILENGTLEAKQAMVNQIWNLAHLPHAFTNEGLTEALFWVEQQLDRIGEVKGPTGS